VKQLASMRDRKNIYDFGVCSCDLLGSKGGGFARLSATSGIQNPELQTDNYSMRHLHSDFMEFYENIPYLLQNASTDKIRS